jgi:hypothetical protein
MKNFKIGAGTVLVLLLIGFLIEMKTVIPGAAPKNMTIDSNQSPPPRAINSKNQTGQSGRSPSAQTPEPDEIAFLLQQAAPDAKWLVRKNQSHKITSISGGLIRLPVLGLNTRLEWAEKLAQWAGFPMDQISRNENSLPETGFSRTVQFQQIYQGYLIDQSFIRITERKSDSAILHSLVDLRDVGEPDLRINFTREEAKALALQHFSQKKTVKIIQASAEPVIYSTQSGQGELAWKLVMKIQGNKYDERRVVISAKSGKTLQDISSLQY